MGLVQREIEAAGFSTISLSMMPELTASVAVPRIAAIEHPFGLPFGPPGDALRQLEVLRATLRALEEISRPGDVVHLPFEWNSGDKLNTHPPEPPPKRWTPDGSPFYLMVGEGPSGGTSEYESDVLG